MFDESEAGRKQRPVTVLAVLFGLLLGFAGTAGQLRVDPATARIGSGNSLRATLNLRSTTRSDYDVADDEAVPALVLPPSSTIVTELVSLRPVAGSKAELAYSAAVGRHSPYHARAPPAA